MRVITDIPVLKGFAGGPENAALPEEFAALLRDVRRSIHRYPEPGFEEHRTSALVRDVLERHGLVVTGPLAATGLCADIQGEEDGPTIAYRADMDALPIQDAKSAEYASERPGFAHLCGHDAHTAVGIGVALILHRNRVRLSGTVRVLFQPDEEGAPGGAVDMIRDGVLDGVQSICAIHVDPTLPVGAYGVQEGAITSSTDRFRIAVTAPGTGHSARPHESVDTVWVASQIVQALYQLTGRFSDARKSSVLTICRFHAGGAYNVIPDQAEFGGTIRTTDPEERAAIRRRVECVARELARLHGAEADIDLLAGAPAVRNDARLARRAASVIQSFCGDKAVLPIPLPSMGSEDFGHYLEKVPGLLVRAGTCSGPETAWPLHNARFDIDESALAPIAALMAHMLCAHLNQGSD